MSYDELQAASGDLLFPAAIRAKLDEVNGAMAAFVVDVARSSAPEVWRAQFAAFLQRWGTFYVEMRDSWTAMMTSTTYSQTERFETQLAAWQADFQAKRYGTVTGPVVQPEAADHEKAASALGTGLKVLGVGLGILGVGWLISKVT